MVLGRYKGKNGIEGLVSKSQPFTIQAKMQVEYLEDLRDTIVKKWRDDTTLVLTNLIKLARRP